jgi:hypothetical protein
MSAQKVVCDFSTSCLQWRNVDDVVMGGLSRSAMQPGSDGTALFSGVLSLERNGGFASVRTALEVRDYARSDRFRIRVKGDGKRYSFRVRNDDRFDGVVYAAGFDTVAGEWVEIDLPFAEFRPLFRGTVVAGAPPMDPGNVAQIGLLISSKQEGPFRLQVAWIEAAGS